MQYFRGVHSYDYTGINQCFCRCIEKITFTLSESVIELALLKQTGFVFDGLISLVYKTIYFVLFIQGRPYQIEAITENFKRTGKCNLQLAREDFFSIFVTFALQKNSPYTKTVSQG